MCSFGHLFARAGGGFEEADVGRDSWGPESCRTVSRHTYRTSYACPMVAQHRNPARCWPTFCQIRPNFVDLGHMLVGKVPRIVCATRSLSLLVGLEAMHGSGGASGALPEDGRPR